MGVAAVPIFASGRPQDVPVTSSTATAIRHANLARSRRLIKEREFRKTAVIGRLPNNARARVSPPPNPPGPVGGATAAVCLQGVGLGGGQADDTAPATHPVAGVGVGVGAAT